MATKANIEKQESQESQVVVSGSYAADADAGFENADQTAFSIPRLYMLQDKSPQAEKRNPLYIEGAETGMLYNTVTKGVYKSIYVVPCYYRQTFVEWYPRDSKAGEGFVEEHLIKQPHWTKARGEPFKNEAAGTIIEDTRNFFVLFAEEVDKDGMLVKPQQIVLSLKSTQVRKAQDWMTVMDGKRGTENDRSFRMPMFSNIFTLESVYETKDPYSWFGWKMTDTNKTVPLENPLYEMARGFRNQIQAGQVEVEPHEAEESTTNSEM